LFLSHCMFLLALLCSYFITFIVILFSLLYFICFFSFFFFFFLMIRRPPRSTLFPTRRSSDLCWRRRRRATRKRAHSWSPRTCSRSEEHTSELQSLAYLVCRLLLEKKKKNTKPKQEKTHT